MFSLAPDERVSGIVVEQNNADKNRSIFSRIQLVDRGVRVKPPSGIVYSTDPRRALGSDGKNYFVKGPDPSILVAETIAHTLARQLGISVPDFALGIASQSSDVYFASCEVPQCLRDVEPWLRRQKVTNSELLPRLLIFDIWIMNYDRNINNLVGHQSTELGSAKLDLVAIDFEKAAALRGPTPLVSAPMIEPTRLWPTGILGQLARAWKRPPDFSATVAAFSGERIMHAFDILERELGSTIAWKESSVALLAKRARNIDSLVSEVWR